MKEITSIGLTEDFAGCQDDWVQNMDSYVKEKYGGVEKYMGSIGMSEEEILSLKRVLSP